MTHDVWHNEHVVLIILAYVKPKELLQAELVNSFFRDIITHTSWRALYLNTYSSLPHVVEFEKNRNDIAKSLHHCSCTPRTNTPKNKKFHLLNSYVNPAALPIPRNPKNIFAPSKVTTYDLNVDIFQLGDNTPRNIISTSHALVAVNSECGVLIHDIYTGEQVGPAVMLNNVRVTNMLLVFDPNEHLRAVKRIMQVFNRTHNSMPRVAVFQLFILTKNDTTYEYQVKRYNIYDIDTGSCLADVVPQNGAEVACENMIPVSLRNKIVNCIDYEPESGLTVISGDITLICKNDHVLSVIIPASKLSFPSSMFVHYPKFNLIDIIKCRIVYTTPELEPHMLYPNTKDYRVDTFSLILTTLSSVFTLRVDLLTEGSKSTVTFVAEIDSEEFISNGRQPNVIEISPSGKHIITSYNYGYDDQAPDHDWTHCINIYDTCSRRSVRQYSGWQGTCNQIGSTGSVALFLADEDLDCKHHIKAIDMSMTCEGIFYYKELQLKPAKFSCIGFHVSQAGHVFVCYINKGVKLCKIKHVYTEYSIKNKK
jgi:hypothetical protein